VFADARPPQMERVANALALRVFAGILPDIEIIL